MWFMLKFVGGDTIWTSQTALFDKLSPTFQKTFEGLHAVHSSEVSSIEFSHPKCAALDQLSKQVTACFHQHYQ